MFYKIFCIHFKIADFIECDQADTPSCKEYYLGNFGSTITRKPEVKNIWSETVSAGYNYYSIDKTNVTNQTDFFVYAEDKLAICPYENTLYDLYSSDIKDNSIGTRSYTNLQKIDAATNQRLCIHFIYEDDYENHKNIASFNKTFNFFGLFDITARVFNNTTTKTVAINKINSEITKRKNFFVNKKHSILF